MAMDGKMANRGAHKLFLAGSQNSGRAGGIEYNACCWSLRFVLQHLTTATQKTTTAAFLQLELNGLMQIGSNPLQVLQRSIPGYTQTGSAGSSSVEGPQSGEHKTLQ